MVALYKLYTIKPTQLSGAFLSASSVSVNGLVVLTTVFWSVLLIGSGVVVLLIRSLICYPGTRLQLIGWLLSKWNTSLPSHEHLPLLSLLQQMLRDWESKRYDCIVHS